MGVLPALRGGIDTVTFAMPRLGAVDAVGLEARAAELSDLVLDRDSTLWALTLAVSLVDLTSAGTPALELWTQRTQPYSTSQVRPASPRNAIKPRRASVRRAR